MSDPHRDGRTQRQRDHEHRRREVDGYLMRGGYRGATRAHQYGHGVEEPGFGRDRNRDRHTENDNLLEYRQAQRRNPCKDLQWPIATIDQHIGRENEHDDPHRDRTCHAAADGTHGRGAEMAEHEYVVQEDVADERQDRRIHDRPRMADALGRKPQREEREDRRRTHGDRKDITDGQVAKSFVDTHSLEHRLHHQLREQDDHDANTGAEIKTLPRVAPDEPRIAGTEVARCDRRDRHEHAEAEREAEEPYTAADGDSRKRIGA